MNRYKSIQRISIFLAIAGILAFTVILRSVYINIPILLVDEALYAEIANVILDGGIPYRDAWEQKPPGIYYLYAMVFALFGRNNLIAVHWTALAAICGTIIGIFLIGKRLRGTVTGLIAGFLYGLMTSAGSPSHFHAANTEIFSVCIAVWGLWIYIRFKSQLIFFSGILFSVSALFKQPGGLLVLPAAALVALDSWGNNTKQALKALLFRYAALIAGIIIPVLIVIVYFMLQHALYDLFMVGYWHNVLYMEGNDLRYGIRAAMQNIPHFIHSTMTFYIIALVRWIISVVIIIVMLCKKKMPDAREIFYFFFFLAGFFGLSLGLRFEGHYFFFLIPAVALLVADAVVCCFMNWRTESWLTGKKSFIVRFTVWSVAVSIYVTGVIYALRNNYSWPLSQRQYLVVMDPQNTAGRVFRYTAEYIRKNTSPDDKIFVWGFCPEIYTLSDRRTASRFVFCNFLIGQMTGDKFYYANIERLDRTIPGAWDKLMSDLSKNKPAYIVDVSRTDYFKYLPYSAERFYLLRDYLKTHYKLENTFGGIYLYRRLP
ncbi:MAG: hypothetical protein AB1454_00465 [Candidatus Auribacterota bacterium]